jgi:hypothetical protein
VAKWLIFILNVFQVENLEVGMKKLFIYVLGLLVVFSAMSMEEPEYKGFKDYAEYNHFLLGVKAACEDVGIPVDKCIYIRGFKGGPGIIMAVFLGRVYINRHYIPDPKSSPEEWLKAYAISQATLHHEVVHIGQQVPGVALLDTIKSLCSFGAASVMGLVATICGVDGALKSREDKSAFQQAKALLGITIGGWCATRMVRSAITIRNNMPDTLKFFKDFNNLDPQLNEREADIQGYNALKCSSCIDAVAWDSRSSSNMGYLTKSEVTAIADEHRKNNHMCNIHRAFRLKESLSFECVQRIVSPFNKSTSTMDKVYQV